MVETATIQQEQTVAEREIEERDALQKYKRLASDFDFGLKADEEYAEQLLDEHRELAYLQLETERVLEEKGDI